MEDNKTYSNMAIETQAGGKSGWIKKCYGKFLGTYKDRYIKVEKYHVAVYENEDLQNSIERLDMEHYDKCLELRSPFKKNRLVLIRAPTCRIKAYDVKFQAQGPEEREAWIKALSEVINRAKHKAFDEITADNGPLKHVTLTRPKASQNRRPPTRIYLKEAIHVSAEGILTSPVESPVNGMALVTNPPDLPSKITKPQLHVVGEASEEITDISHSSEDLGKICGSFLPPAPSRDLKPSLLLSKDAKIQQETQNLVGECSEDRIITPVQLNNPEKKAPRDGGLGNQCIPDFPVYDGRRVWTSKVESAEFRIETDYIAEHVTLQTPKTVSPISLETSSESPHVRHVMRTTMQALPKKSIVQWSLQDQGSNKKISMGEEETGPNESQFHPLKQEPATLLIHKTKLKQNSSPCPGQLHPPPLLQLNQCSKKKSSSWGDLLSHPHEFVRKLPIPTESAISELHSNVAQELKSTENLFDLLCNGEHEHAPEKMQFLVGEDFLEELAAKELIVNAVERLRRADQYLREAACFKESDSLEKKKRRSI